MNIHVIHAEHDDPPSQVGQAMYDADAALNHLIELRNCPDTRADMALEEVELWRLKNTLEWLLTSIKIERETITVEAAE
jgi:hypothetical protein